MAMRLILNHWRDWLLPGSPSDSRLFHSDSSDRIHVCPPHLGQGYFQEILLQDDLTLFICDYTLNQDVLVDVSSERERLELVVQIGSNAGYSFFIPFYGSKKFDPKQARKRVFNVKVCFKRPTLITYFQAFLERLSPQTHCVAERAIQAMYRYQGGGPSSTLIGMLNRIFDCAIAADPHCTPEQVSTAALYAEAIALKYAVRSPMTSAMQQLIGQILSCPYQGSTRRTYLECKALELVGLYLKGMIRPRLKEVDFNCIDQAAAILRKQVANPPTVEALARLVGTNRLYLNRGFHQVYGVTPFGYSRDCRLWQARRLLLTSDLSIGKVAVAVGYTCPSHFTKAFHRGMGLNPKAFQMAAWQGAIKSEQSKNCAFA
ncbi:MAG: AraC family transcriptional regulator [Cyanobacteria bacterium P01_F01_bin.53]